MKFGFLWIHGPGYCACWRSSNSLSNSRPALIKPRFVKALGEFAEMVATWSHSSEKRPTWLAAEGPFHKRSAPSF